MNPVSNLDMYQFFGIFTPIKPFGKVCGKNVLPWGPYNYYRTHLSKEEVKIKKLLCTATGIG